MRRARAAAAVLGLALAACGRRPPARTRAEVTPTVVRLRSVTVHRESAAVIATLAGRFEPSERTVLFAPSPGRVERVDAELGARIAPGRTLVVLGSTAPVEAPYECFVVSAFVAPGARVERGARLVEVARMSPLRLVVDVPEQDVAAVPAPGDAAESPVNIRVPALGDDVRQARVSRVARLLDERTHRLRVEIDVPNDDARLYAGLEAQVRFPRSARRDVLSLPAEAVIPERDGHVVFVLEGGRARRRRVRTGADDGARIEVIDGLRGEEELLVGGRGMLEDGTRVEVARGD